jgi:hypothetical protein
MRAPTSTRELRVKMLWPTEIIADCRLRPSATRMEMFCSG